MQKLRPAKLQTAVSTSASKGHLNTMRRKKTTLLPTNARRRTKTLPCVSTAGSSDVSETPVPRVRRSARKLRVRRTSDKRATRQRLATQDGPLAMMARRRDADRVKGYLLPESAYMRWKRTAVQTSRRLGYRGFRSFSRKEFEAEINAIGDPEKVFPRRHDDDVGPPQSFADFLWQLEGYKRMAK